jgi:hypothetical protein
MPLEQHFHTFVAAEPGCTSASLSNEGSKLAVPVPEQTLVPMDRGNDAEYPGLRYTTTGCLQRYLHLAFDEFDWCQENGSDCASDHTTVQHA